MSENTKPVTDDSFATDVLGASGPVLVVKSTYRTKPVRQERWKPERPA